jgi:hypothetical protein
MTGATATHGAALAIGRHRGSDERGGERKQPTDDEPASSRRHGGHRRPAVDVGRLAEDRGECFGRGDHHPVRPSGTSADHPEGQRSAHAEGAGGDRPTDDGRSACPADDRRHRRGDGGAHFVGSLADRGIDIRSLRTSPSQTSAAPRFRVGERSVSTRLLEHTVHRGLLRSTTVGAQPRQSRVRESNPRPHDYKSSALPTELTRRTGQATRRPSL